MIRSSNVSLKFSNASKKESVESFVDEYARVVSVFVDEFWTMDKVPKLLPHEVTTKPDTWLSARARQCAAKQASGIVRGTKAKANKREWQINEFIRLGMHKKARRLKRIHDLKGMSKPDITNVCPELDSRFISIDLDNKTSFDGWVSISSIGNKVKLDLPFKKTRHFLEMTRKGKLKPGIRLSKDYATLMFEIDAPQPKKDGKTLGIDIGVKNVISCSNGFASNKDNHGHDLDSILKKLSRRKKGSNGFHRATSHRENHVNWSINQLNLADIKQVNIEKIRHLRSGKRTSRHMGHWTYTTIFGKLERYCEEQGVLVRQVNPTYTSQRCSECGWVRKGNRRGKLFKCDKCSTSMDSDLNASINLSLDLRPIGQKERLSQNNRKGFYWNVTGQEHIVPDTKKPVISYFS